MKLRHLLWATPLLLVAGTASADVPNEPCMGLSAGDPCTTIGGADGICEDQGGFIACVEASSTTSGSGAVFWAWTGKARKKQSRRPAALSRAIACWNRLL